MKSASDLAPIEDLDRNILTVCKHINAATYELLVLIREFDERAGWLKWGLRNCAEWLAWRCDFSMTTVELPLDTGELIEKALDKARDDEVLAGPELAETSWSTRQADAFVNMVGTYLSGNDSRAQSSAHSKAHANDNYLVTVHVDQAALAGGEGRSALPIESVKRLCCDSQAVVIVEDDKGEPLSIGRKSRVVPRAMQRALSARDNHCCTFPGCHNRRYLHSHHVEHWANGGETSLENLLLLCTRHHTQVHEGGFRIEKDFQDRWAFLRPDGIAVPSFGYRTDDMLDEDVYARHSWSEAVEIPPAGGLLSKAENKVFEPAPPAYLH